ncbi:MAG: hypothetical protein M1358_22270 [Chloroflexi bacterium]|nr:hypothetical protein [Chloroflexota bacterium]
MVTLVGRRLGSGFAESDRLRLAQALVAGAQVGKPMTMERLAHAVKEELDRQSRPGRPPNQPSPLAHLAGESKDE